MHFTTQQSETITKLISLYNYNSSRYLYIHVYECVTIRAHYYLLVPSINERPRIADLQNYITPNFATKWKEIGIGLGLTQERINIIEEDNRNKCEKQCNAMLYHWLEVKSINATWKKLLTILDSPAVNIFKADQAISIIQTDPAVNIIQTNSTINIIQADPTVNIVKTHAKVDIMQTDHGQSIHVHM